jgi:hypothetical protein
MSLFNKRHHFENNQRDSFQMIALAAAVKEAIKWRVMRQMKLSAQSAPVQP